MSFKVFYAWQMDTRTKLNRWFIEGAIKTAIRKVKTESQQEAEDELRLERADSLPADADVVDPDAVADSMEDADIVLQWGAYGHTGATLIAETILERIADCGVFIADVSFVVQAKTADGRDKRLPNSSVMIEVGAASRLVGWERMILVMNTHYGPVDDLPFDMKHRHCQVKYSLDAWDDAERTKKAKQLAVDITDQLRPMYRAALFKSSEARRKSVEAEAFVRHEQLQRAQKERIAYEDKLLNNTYKSFKAKAAMVAVTIIPASPTPIHVPSGYDFYKGLAPIMNEMGVVKHEMKAELCYWPTDDKPPSSITELSHDGSIYAVRNMLYFHGEQEPDQNRRSRFAFIEYEEVIVKAVRRYLGCLIELKAKGPWFVGLSLLKMRTFQLSVGNFAIDDAYIKEGDQENIQTDLVPVPAEVDISKPDAIAGIMKRSLRQVWRAFHLPGRPNFREDGSWFSYDEGRL